MLFQRAAALHGQSLSNYVVSTVQKAAEEALRDHEIMTLSAHDSRIFVEALLNPPEPNDALRVAFADHQEFTGQ
jgi:uncharacterized protein (DUF1778 family)